MANNKTYTLDSQSAYLWLILGREHSPLTKEFSFYYEKLVAWCKINARLWCIIGHDKDVNDNGEPKYRHIHALIVLKEGVKPRLSTSLNRIAKTCDLPTVDVDIQIAESVTSCIRYCLHRGYPLKYQYDVSELITSLASEDLTSYLNVENTEITANYLINLVELCNCSILLILREIGLKKYARYRNVIIDIVREFNG